MPFTVDWTSEPFIALRDELKTSSDGGDWKRGYGGVCGEVWRRLNESRAVCKDNAAVNCVTVRQKFSLPSTLADHTPC